MTSGDHDSSAKGARPAKEQGGGSHLGLIAGAATAGAALGVLAVVGLKAAVQAPTLLAGDWPKALATEHQAVLRLFDSIEATDSRATLKRTMLLALLKHALARHALEEENAVYPALRDGGKAEGADELTAEHGYVKQYLYDLDNMPKGSPAFMEKIAAFRRDVEEHIREEEDRLFPALFASLDAEANKKLTRAINREGFKLA